MAKDDTLASLIDGEEDDIMDGAENEQGVDDENNPAKSEEKVQEDPGDGEAPPKVRLTTKQEREVLLALDKVDFPWLLACLTSIAVQIGPEKEHSQAG
jgi:hypothetical protein